MFLTRKIGKDLHILFLRCKISYIIRHLIIISVSINKENLEEFHCIKEAGHPLSLIPQTVLHQELI